jgi:hypothetical protein
MDLFECELAARRKREELIGRAELMRLVRQGPVARPRARRRLAAGLRALAAWIDEPRYAYCQQPAARAAR